MRGKKRRIWIGVLLCAAALIGIAAGTAGYRATLREERRAMDSLTAAARRAGLKDVRVTTDGWKRRSIAYTVFSSNFSDLTFPQMQRVDALVNDPDSCGIREFWVISCEGSVSYGCRGDRYTVSDDRITRNGTEIYNREDALEAVREQKAAMKAAREKAKLEARMAEINRRSTYGESWADNSGDVYDAKDYDDVDQFYDDHYDDFESFDEAEQYWQEYNH